MTAAFGITRIRCALSPPYKLRTPSSAMTSLKVCASPVYLTWPLTSGCLNLVRMTYKKNLSAPYPKSMDAIENEGKMQQTSCGYVIKLATHFAVPALPNIPAHSATPP
jgi:hypothetical protein